jgi:DNA polymerase-3 subunit epsilon
MRPSSDGCGCFPTGRHYPAIAHLLRGRVAGLASELDADRAWTELPIAVLDVETTGKDPSDDRVVELAIVRGLRGEVLARNAWLMNPGRPIPQEAVKVHGIRDEDVRDKPAFADVCAEIAAALEAAIPCAYNAPFDRGFVLAEVARAGWAPSPRPPALRPDVAWLDPLVWARHLQANARSRSLGDVAARLGVQLDHAHRATADAEATLGVMARFAEDRRVPKTYGQLMQEQARLARAQEEARQMWRRGGG